MGLQPTYFDETGWRVTKRGRYSPRHKVGELRIQRSNDIIMWNLWQTNMGMEMSFIGLSVIYVHVRAQLRSETKAGTLRQYTHMYLYIYNIIQYYTYTNRKTTYIFFPQTMHYYPHHHSLPALSLPLPASVTPPGKIGLQPSPRGIQNAEKFRPTQGLKLASLYHV
jgi:hypothetical protein